MRYIGIGCNQSFSLDNGKRGIIMTSLCCMRYVAGLAVLGVGMSVAVADPVMSGAWQKLTSRYPVLPDNTDAAMSMTLRSDFTLNTAEPMLIIDVNRHPLPMCTADGDSGLEPVALGNGTLNGHTQAFGYRCMGGQMTIVAWPTQQSATYWKEQIVAQQPLSLTVAGVSFQSANTNGKHAMSVASRVFME